MAFVDLNNNKIVGCEKYSLTWYHEKGHIIYNNSEYGMNKDFSRQTMKTLTLVFSVLSHFHWILLILSCAYLFFWVYYALFEELWCWVYAFKIKRKHKNNDHKCLSNC